MRLRWNDALLALALAALVPSVGAAEDDNLRREMDEMRNMILQLQDTVSTQSGEIAEQKQVIDRAGIEDVTLGGDAGSGISSFLQNVDIKGWVSFTYFHNLDDLDNNNIISGNTGANGCCVPFAGRDDNSFTVQQLWFQMGKAATKEDRGGFFAEIAFGRDAAFLPGGNTSATFDGGNNLYLNSAYVEYLATVAGQDIKIKGGKFATLIGYEVAQAPYNWNITRANVYNLLQPIDHVGILVETAWENGFDLKLGVVNDPYGQSQPDFNDGKTFLGHVGYTAESWSVALNGLWGNDVARNEHPDIGIIDLIVTWNPLDKLAFWMNADYVVRDDNRFSDDPNAWGLILAGRYAWTERLGTSLRWEFVDDDGRELVFHGGGGCSGADNLDAGGNAFETECQIQSVTGTVDFKLTEALTVKGEVRFDKSYLKGVSSDTVFTDSDGPGQGGEQLLVGFEAIYQF